MFNRPVTWTKSIVLDATSAVVAASPEVLSKQRSGRHTISITASGATVYIGGSDVTTANGTPIKDGTTLTIPVSSDRVDQVYVVGGKVRLTEWF